VFFCNAYIKWRTFVRRQKSNGLYSKLSHDITKSLKKAPIVEKQASMNFTWILQEWIGFMVVTNGQTNSRNQSQKKQDCLCVIRLTRRFQKLEPANQNQQKIKDQKPVETFESVVHPKFDGW
jgi:hypothetical protein